MTLPVDISSIDINVLIARLHARQDKDKLVYEEKSLEEEISDDVLRIQVKKILKDFNYHSDFDIMIARYAFKSIRWDSFKHNPIIDIK